MFQKIAKHRANDASLTMHRTPLCSCLMSRPPFNWLLMTKCFWTEDPLMLKDDCKKQQPVEVVLNSAHEVITWLVHWSIDSMVLMICKETSLPFWIFESNYHPEQLGGGVFLVLPSCRPPGWHPARTAARSPGHDFHHWEIIGRKIWSSFENDWERFYQSHLGPHCDQVVSKVLQQLKRKIELDGHDPQDLM